MRRDRHRLKPARLFFRKFLRSRHSARRSVVKALWWGFVWALAGCLAGQDVLILKSGARLEGRIAAESSASLTLEFPGGAMEIRREDIGSVARGAAPTTRPGSPAALDALRRIPDGEEWYLLQKGSRRIGWRLVTFSRELRAGIPTHVRRDRCVVPGCGQTPDLDLTVTEWVDGGLLPKAYSVRFIASGVVRTTEATFGAAGIEVVERSNGLERRSLIPVGATLELPGFLLRRRAVEAGTAAPRESVVVVDPRRGEVIAGSLVRERRGTGSEARTRIELADAHGVPVAGVVTDGSGKWIAEEIGGRDLVAVRVDPKTAAAVIAAGFSAPESVDRVAVGDVGLTIDRPDDTWTDAGATSVGVALSWHHTPSGSTVEIFTPAGMSNPGEFLRDLATRILADDPEAKIGVATAVAIGGTDGIAFRVETTRRGVKLHATAYITRGTRGPALVMVTAPTVGGLGEATLASVLGTLAPTP